MTPNRGRRATFYNFWAGPSLRSARFHARQREDLGAVLLQLRAGELTAYIGARVPLTRATEALALADGRSPYGKIVMEPGVA